MEVNKIKNKHFTVILVSRFISCHKASKRQIYHICLLLFLYKYCIMHFVTPK